MHVSSSSLRKNVSSTIKPSKLRCNTRFKHSIQSKPPTTSSLRTKSQRSFAARKNSVKSATTEYPITLDATLPPLICAHKPLAKTKLRLLTHSGLLYRVAYLRTILHSASQSYYLNQPGVALTDSQFDKLFGELHSIESTTPPHHLTIIDHNPQSISDLIVPSDIEQFRSHIPLLTKKDSHLNIISELIINTPWQQLHSVIPTSVTTRVGAISTQVQSTAPILEQISEALHQSIPLTNNAITKTSPPASVKAKKPLTSVSEGKRLLKHEYPMKSIQSVFDLKSVELFSKSSLKTHINICVDTKIQFTTLMNNLQLPKQLSPQQQSTFSFFKQTALRSPFYSSAQPEALALFYSMLSTFFTLAESKDLAFAQSLGSIIDSLGTFISHAAAQQNILNRQSTVQSPPLYQTSEYKYDGIALSIDFVNGKQSRVITRGDGEQGFDVGETLKTYANSPQKLDTQQLDHDLKMLFVQQFIYSLLQFTQLTTTSKLPSHQTSIQLWDQNVVQPLLKALKSDKKTTTTTINLFQHDFPSVSSSPAPHYDPLISQTIANILPHVIKLVDKVLSTHSADVQQGSLNIRGECIVPRASWTAGGHYSSPRHYVSGLFNSLEATDVPSPSLVESKTKVVDFLPYSVSFTQDHIQNVIKNSVFTTSLPTLLSHSQRLLLLKNQQFHHHSGVTHFIQASALHNGPITSECPTNITPTPIPIDSQFNPFESNLTVSEHVAHLELGQTTFPYDCDGLVLKSNSTLIQNAAGSTSHHPRWAIAPKFQGEYATTIIQDIQLQVGKSGKVVPVALLRPAFVGGSLIQKVVLHNHNQLSNELFSGMKIGDEVTVEKRGGAIPMISGRGDKTYKELQLENSAKNDTWIHNLGKKLIDILPCRIDSANPSKTMFLCPCPKKTVLENIENSTGSTSASLFCVSELCESKVVAVLSFYSGKNGLDIPSLSTMTLEALYQVNLIDNHPSSMLRLVYDGRYRSALYKLGGFATPDIHLLSEQQTGLKPISTHWDGMNILPKTKSGSLPPSPPSIFPGQIPGFQKKKIEKLLAAIEQQHLSTTPEEHNRVLETILMGYGLTQTHINALKHLAELNLYPTLMDALPIFCKNLSVEQIAQQTDIRAATARDLMNKFQNIQHELLTLANYGVPCLQSLKQSM